MNILNFLDANVWLALIWNRHSHSVVARSWLDAVADEQLLYCRFTQLAVLRLLTTPAVMGSDVCTMKGAWGIWDRIAADERVSFLSEPEGLEAHFRKNSRAPSVSPKMWADAYLLAFARAAGVKLVTFDQALGRRGCDVLVIGRQ